MKQNETSNFSVTRSTRRLDDPWTKQNLILDRQREELDGIRSLKI